MKTYEITVYPSDATQSDMYYLYINGKITGSYLDKRDALQKIANSLRHYKGIKENQVKNVMYHSNNNSHNCII